MSDGSVGVPGVLSWKGLAGAIAVFLALDIAALLAISPLFLGAVPKQSTPTTEVRLGELSRQAETFERRIDALVAEIAALKGGLAEQRLTSVERSLALHEELERLKNELQEIRQELGSPGDSPP